MVHAFAGDDAEVLAQIKADVEAERDKVVQKFAAAADEGEHEEKVETINIFCDTLGKLVRLVVPRGGIQKKIGRFVAPSVLQTPLTDTIAKITAFYDGAELDPETICVPGFFARPRQQRSDCLKEELKLFKQKLSALTDLTHLAKAWLDHSRPVDPARLQHLYDVANEQMKYLRNISDEILIKNY